MADASFLQSSFLGGEVSPYAQGRSEDPNYRTCLNVCRNGFPVEEGGWTRRSGSRYCATTFLGGPAALRAFHFNLTNPYLLELTSGTMRAFDGAALVLDSVNEISSISSADPAVITTISNHTWASGDEVVMFRSDQTDTNFTPGLLMNRTFFITVSSSTQFSIYDPITGTGFDGSTVTLDNHPIAIGRVLRLKTPYSDEGTASGFDLTKLVQGPDFALLTHPVVKPQLVATLEVPTTTSPAIFSIQDLALTDGPYLDAPDNATTLTPSGTSGSVTLTYSINGYVAVTTYALGDVVSFNGNGYTSLANANTGNQPDISSSFWQLNVSASGLAQYGFLSTDVGRAVRLFSEPAAYASGTTYAAGASVKYAGTYWTSLVAGNIGHQPDISLTYWEVTPSAALWTWGLITGWTDATHVTLQLKGGNLLNTNAITVYRLGVYSDTTGYPTCGVYCEGRLWLAGVIPNRLDASMSNRPFDFTPTAADGTVADNNAIAATFQSEENNAVYWLAAENSGVILGTKGGEWLATASNLNDPLTPSSIQIRKTTKFGCQDIVPQRTPMALLFVQRFGKKLIEYIPGGEIGKYTGTNLAAKAKHLTEDPIQEIAFVGETTPILWARTDSGKLIGMTYKRESPYGTQPAQFAGWHRHDLGSGRVITSIQSGPSQGGDIDALTVVTNDPTTGIHWVETLAEVFRETADITEAWDVDGSAPSTAAKIDGTNLVLAGYYYLAGKTIAAWIAGVDAGDITVAADGTVTIPLTGSLLNTTWLNTVSNNGIDYTLAGIRTPPTSALVAGTPGFANITNLKVSETDRGSITAGTLGINWNNNLVITRGGTNGMRLHKVPNGNETSNVNVTVGNTTGGNPLIVDTQGHVYFFNGTSNYDTARKMSYASFIGNDLFGKSGTFSGPLATPYGGIFVPAGNRTYVIFAGYQNVERQITFINADTWSSNDATAYANFSFPVKNCQGKVVPGRSSSNPRSALGDAYCQGAPDSHNSVSADVGLSYAKFTVLGTTWAMQTLGTIQPSTIQTGAPGVKISDAGDPIFDPLDDCIITFLTFAKAPSYNGATAYNIATTTTGTDHVVGSDGNVYAAKSATTGNDPTTDGGVHWQLLGSNSYTLKQYMMAKINPRTGALVWATQVSPSSFTTLYKCNNQTRLTGRGTLYYLFGDGNLSKIDTATGAITNAGSMAGLTFISGQAYDDVTGSLYVSCSYAQSTGPSPINDTPTSFSGWAFFQGTNFDPSGANPTTPPLLPGQYSFPAILGYTYTSQGQIVRPVSPEEAGTRNGPSLGKSGRVHMYSALLARTQGISFGTAFDGTTALYPSTLADASKQTSLPLTTLFNGVEWGTVQDDYNFDSMLAWQITRPYPATVLTAGSFQHTQDR